MTPEDVKGILSGLGIDVLSEERLPNDTGTQLRCTEGAIVNLYDTGKIVVTGKKNSPVGKVREALKVPHDPPRTPSAKSQPNKKVFVVYGHDSAARTQLENMLRRWELEPMILDQLPSEGQTIIEKLESYTGQVGFAVVLATPDDEGHRVDHPDEKACRARQNVVLELGMMLAKLGRKRVAVLIKQSEKMERPSDIQGLIYIPFKDDLAKDTGVVLAKEMTQQGYDIKVAQL